MDDRVVAAPDTVPALVAVHGVVASADGRDTRRWVRSTEARLQIDEVPGRGPRWRVAAVEQAMDDDVADAQLVRHLGQRDQVPVVGVDAARADEADERQPTIVRGGGCGRPRPGPRWCGRCRRGWRRRCAADPGARADRHRGSDARPPSCPSGHPAGRRHARRRRARMRPGVEQRPPAGHPGGGHGIALGTSADAEAVEDDEDDRLGSSAERARSSVRHRAVAVSARARAVRPARATMPAISSTFRLAPPTSAPSMPGSARNSPMAALVTLPPYRTGTASASMPWSCRPHGSRRPSARHRRRTRSARCRWPRQARRR